jgi:hypothetical protein
MDTAAFWDGVAKYNQATWPVQAVMIIAAGYLTYRVVAAPGPTTDLLMKAFLALAFTWNGVAFFLVYVRSPIATFIGAPLFFGVAILNIVDIFGGKTHFSLPDGGSMRWFTIAWIVLTLLYPAIGWPLGHTYPHVLLPLFPCPLTVFALALVTAAVPNADWKLLTALLPWALLGLPKCFGALECYEDWVLFGAGVYGLVVLVRNWRSIRWGQRLAQTTG